MMTDDQLKKHNEGKIAELFPLTAEKIRRVLQGMQQDGIRCVITCAARSPEKQMQAYLSGHSSLKWGLHCARSKDGKPEALAADILKADDADDPNGEDDLYHAPKSYYILLGHHAKLQGMKTGITWGLPDTLREGVLRAIAQKDLTYKGKLGWDPGHVQENIESGIAKDGGRPKS